MADPAQAKRYSGAMPRLQHYKGRRSQFLAVIQTPVLLMAGGWRSRNYPDNPYVYRPDSNFLFLFHEAEPGSAALFDPGDQSVTLFLHRRTPEDALWHGPVPSLAEMGKKHGLPIEPVEELAEKGRGVKTAELSLALLALGNGRPECFDDDGLGHVLLSYSNPE